MAAEGMRFPWRLNRSAISANLELIWEMAVNYGEIGMVSPYFAPRISTHESPAFMGYPGQARGGLRGGAAVIAPVGP